MGKLRNEKHLSFWDTAKVMVTPGIDQVERERILQEKADANKADEDRKRAEEERLRKAGKAARKDVGY
jgi:hypothetical protein